jgi:hypothetical protein
VTVEQHQRTGPSEILTIRQGLVAGIVAALVMAVVAMVGSGLIDEGLWTPINAIGSFFVGSSAVPIPPGPAGAVTVVGVVVQLAVGGLLGMLYASAQSPEDTLSLIVIGVFYGLVTYIVSRLALRWLNPAVFAVWRSWPVFIGQLLFGATLAVFAISRNPLRKRAVRRP